MIVITIVDRNHLHERYAMTVPAVPAVGALLLVPTVGETKSFRVTDVRYASASVRVLVEKDGSESGDLLWAQ